MTEKVKELSIMSYWHRRIVDKTKGIRRNRKCFKIKLILTNTKL
jgi:hypothetical protein